MRHSIFLKLEWSDCTINLLCISRNAESKKIIKKFDLDKLEYHRNDLEIEASICYNPLRKKYFQERKRWGSNGY